MDLFNGWVIRFVRDLVVMVGSSGMVHFSVRALRFETESKAVHFPKEAIQELRKQELRLKRRSGIRVRVDRIAADRTHVLCTAWRSGVALFQSPLDEHEVVHLVHTALRSLNRSGLRPLIGVVKKSNLAEVPRIIKADPFHLISALNGAEELRSGQEGIAQAESDRRAALLAAGHVLR
jgi:hypothetical protein